MPSANDYAHQLKALLPPGSLWLLDSDSILSLAMLAVAEEFGRVDGRALQLLEEWDPSTASECLSDWERVLGLPDGCLPTLLSTVAGRQFNALRKYTQRGGQARQFFIDLCAAMGAPVTIDEFIQLVLRVGFRVGDRCYDTTAAHTWRVNFTTGVRLPPPDSCHVAWFSSVGGSLVPGTYSYRVAAYNAYGITLACASSNAVAGAGTNTNRMRITWPVIDGATGYSIYGRTGGTERQMTTVAAGTNAFTDDGSITPDAGPDGTLPAKNTAVSEVGKALECILTRAKPAQSIVKFAYS